jgi:hypothetical protein
MKRLDQKVKDIVEVRASPGLTNFFADPAATLKGYHFTDITADLMAKWVGQIADIKKGSGAALALAGFRGVGKSHFLAVLSAIVSQPECRTKITDTHVTSTAQRLSRRHGVVAHLQRGSHDSLLSELKAAIAGVTGNEEPSDSISEILQRAADKCGDMPLVLLIDTALGRESRVTRDDGALLSEIAAAAKTNGIFVGIALDDDIAGADGSNSSIASNFTIDYLDQEHLYKVVDTHVFPKKDQMRPLLHEIYHSYREAMPGFRWSEHRFSSLYPMHPAILEIAPFVRLYLHDFALLGFAVEAGLRILGRPANSLIGLEEVFDSAESRLRNIHDLKDAFAAFDALDRNVVASAPVVKRHEAKLILKGFLLLSFNGEGVTATELASSMMIFDAGQPAAGAASVEAMLQAFCEAEPNAVTRSESAGRPTKYGLKIGSREDLSTALTEAIKILPAAEVESVLKRITAEKFSDFDISDDGSSLWATSYIVWRGGIRPGEVIWLTEGAPLPETNNESGNWKVFIEHGPLAESDGVAYSWPASVWKLGALTTDDIDTIRRFHVLQTDSEMRENFKDSIPTMLHVHSIAVEKIWHRIFLEESRLITGTTEYKFSEQAQLSSNLAQLFTDMLEDQLESQFSAHPVFPETLGAKEVSALIEHLFSGSGSNDAEIQKLAANFAMPLGLVYDNAGVFSPIPVGELSHSVVVKEVIDLSPLDNAEIVSLSDISSQMQAAPYGLTQEAQHLVLGALVAQRQFEFVTSSENRINHRSLDLQIIWEDIVGIAKPSGDAYSVDRLLAWASLLAADPSILAGKPSEARLNVIGVLSDWLADWQRSDPTVQFNALPDEKLNSKVWRTASNVKKTFGVIAEAIDGLLQDAVTLDKCLQTIADAFADSEEEFQSKQNDLVTLRQFISRTTDLDDINAYLALCEPTTEPEIECLRSDLMEFAAAGYFDKQDAAFSDLIEKWVTFKRLYSEHYVEKHDHSVASGRERKQLNEFLGREDWTTFAALSEIPWFGRNDMEIAMAKIREIRTPVCGADVRKILETRPFCSCSFSLKNSPNGDGEIDQLAYTVAQGIDYFRRKMLGEQSAFYLAFGEMSKRHQGHESLSTLEELVPAMENGHDFPVLTASQIHILKNVTRNLDTSGSLHNDRRRTRMDASVAFDPSDWQDLEKEMGGLTDFPSLNP